MPRFPDQESLIRAFLTNYERSNTTKTHRLALDQLARWALENRVVHLAEMTAPHFDLYADYLAKGNNAWNTRVTKQGIIKRFFDYLVRSGTLKKSPVPEGWVPRAQISAAVPRLSDEQRLALLEASKRHRNALDIGLVISLGGFDSVKIKHIVSLCASDVRFGDDGDARIPVRFKDGTSERRHLSPESSVLLRDAIAVRPDGPLCYPDYGDRTDSQYSVIRRNLQAVARMAGVQGAVTPRILEMSARTSMVEAGLPVAALAERLGLATETLGWQRRRILPQHGAESVGETSLVRAVQQSDAIELLKQAEFLCDQRDVTPIAPIVIAGAALEMVLRQMCDEHEIVPTAKSPGIDAYSTALRQRSLIGKHAHSTNQANAQLRNLAAHGIDSADVTIPQARLMIQSVTMFLSRGTVE